MKTSTATPTANKIEVKAYSEEHARMIAAGRLGLHPSQIKHIITMSKTRQTKTTSVTDYPAKGTRKWVSEYEIWAYGERIPLGKDKFTYTNMEYVKGGFTDKSTAVKEAREMTLKHHIPMTIKLVKKLETGHDSTSDLEPNTQAGHYTVLY